MKKNTSLDTVLEIFLITCNRSACLDNTLRQLKDSPFARCRFTLLDNCSTDDTPNIAEQYRDQFPNYRIIRHNRNIGGDNNFLRAVELSTSLYTWILCDDDNYDFTYAQEIISEIESCKYDLIYVASRSSEQMGWPGFGETTVGQLIREGARYHRASAFWPSLIFKTERFDNYCFINAPYLFPSMLFINKAVRDDFLIYVSKHEIVIRSQGSTMEISPLYLYKEWLTNSLIISDKNIRSMVIDQWTDKGFLKTLFFWIALEKANHAEGYFKRLVDIMFALTFRQRMKFMLLLPVMIVPIPKTILMRTREIAYRIIGQKDSRELPPIEREER
jgi:glycosyltransferase involved in cell wall biosynthesis